MTCPDVGTGKFEACLDFALGYRMKLTLRTGKSRKRNCDLAIELELVASAIVATKTDLEEVEKRIMEKIQEHANRVNAALVTIAAGIEVLKDREPELSPESVAALNGVAEGAETIAARITDLVGTPSEPSEEEEDVQAS